MAGGVRAIPLDGAPPEPLEPLGEAALPEDEGAVEEDPGAAAVTLVLGRAVVPLSPGATQKTVAPRRVNPGISEMKVVRLKLGRLEALKPAGALIPVEFCR